MVTGCVNQYQRDNDHISHQEGWRISMANNFGMFNNVVPQNGNRRVGSGRAEEENI